MYFEGKVFFLDVKFCIDFPVILNATILIVIWRVFILNLNKYPCETFCSCDEKK